MTVKLSAVRGAQVSGCDPITAEKCRDRLDLATAWIVHKRPYYVSALYGLTEHWTKSVPTLGVSQDWLLAINPGFIAEHTAGEVSALLLHEINHLLREHPDRCKWRDPIVWNMAADAEINDELSHDLRFDSDVNLPDGGITASAFGLPERLLAEVYYDKLLESGQCQGSSGEGSQSAQGESGDGESDSSGETGSGSAQGESGDDESDSSGETGSGVASGDCGSCAHGHGTGDGDSDLRAEASAMGIEPISEADAELVLTQVAREVEAYEKAHVRARGSVPAGLRRFAEQRLRPKVPWQRVLRRHVARTATRVRGNDDFTWQKRSRRQGVAGDLILPGTCAYSPNAAVVLDTSGSVSGDELSSMLDEVSGILDATCESVAVLSCDAAVHSVVYTRSVAKVEPSGGGGTDMRVGIAEAAKLTPRPDVVIVFTDGFTPWPAVPPRGVDVVVCIVGSDESGVTHDVKPLREVAAAGF